MNHPVIGQSPFMPRVIRCCVVLGLLVSSVVACSASTSAWKEEVLLHDGRKMVVERSNTYRGRSEPGHSGPIGEHRLSFTLPGGTEKIIWISEYSDDLGRTNFYAIAVHVLQQTPYVVAWPNLCPSYAKWGRPNPPYVVFKFQAGSWHRVPLGDLPEQFKTVNLSLGIQRLEADHMARAGLVSADAIREANRDTRRPEFRTILRDPLSNERIQEMCPQYPGLPKAPS